MKTLRHILSTILHISIIMALDKMKKYLTICKYKDRAAYY